MKSIKITLSGNPRSTQHNYYHRNNIRIFKKEARELKESYIWEAKSQYKGGVLDCDLCVEVRLFFGDKRKRDWDNYHKLSMDALEGIVYKDDTQIQKAVVTKHYDKENPRMEIEINKINDYKTNTKNIIS